MTAADRALLRSISLATAFPLAIGGVLAGSATSELQRPRQKPPIADQESAASSGGEWDFPRVRLVLPNQLVLLADASTLDVVDLGLPQSNASTVVGPSAIASDLDLDFIASSLQEVGDLLQTRPDELPNEQPIRTAAVAAAVDVVFELESVPAPLPQIIARGDGGLQIVWYAADRDLEIEILPNGSRSIIEFDGQKTRRIAYNLENVASALSSIQESLSTPGAAA